MKQFQHISVVGLQEKLTQENSTISIVDIRDRNSYLQGHLVGAFHLTGESLASFIDSTEFDQTIIVVCYHGNSSQRVAQHLIEQGFDNVYSLDGGFEEWHHTELPIEVM